MPLTLAIRGLCLVTYRKAGYYDVLLHGAAGTHKSVLTILTKYLRPDPNAKNRWDPDRLGFIPVTDSSGKIKFEQVGMWDIVNTSVTFSNTPKAQDWADRKDTTVAFDHPKLHDTDCKAVTATAGNGLSIIRIDEGTPMAFDAPEFTLENKKGKKEKVKGTFEIRFTDVPAAVQSGGKVIQFEPEEADPFASISNQAAEPSHDKAREHFIHYYHLLRDSSGNEFGPDFKFHLKDQADVIYDCVPPGTAP